MSIILEQEVKFRLTSVEDVAAKLSSIGAEMTKPRHFESNQLFDFGDSRIEKRGSALRLRKVEGDGWLTFKGPQHGSGKIKQRRELETPLADPQAMEEILAALGLEECFRYEKYRTVYRASNALLCLDETPIGPFLEIEGQPEAIQTMVTSLSLPLDEAIISSYPRLYELHRQEFPEAPTFMIFKEPPAPR